jgi:hypothetical protein
MMALPDVNQGMIITTSGFSQGATKVARVRNAPMIVLIDGDRLGDLHIEHGFGAKVEQVEPQDQLIVAVPLSTKFRQLADKWRRAPLVQRCGIGIVLVGRDGTVEGLDLP